MTDLDKLAPLPKPTPGCWFDADMVSILVAVRLATAQAVAKRCAEIGRLYDLGTPDGHAVAACIEAEFGITGEQQ